MIHFLVCTRVSHQTGHRLADAITELQGSKCYYYNRNTPPHPELRHVRWGSHRVTSDNCLNRLAPVRLASNKLLALTLIRQHDVQTPNLVAGDAFHETSNVRRIAGGSPAVGTGCLPT